jgi:hypothetical protein
MLCNPHSQYTREIWIWGGLQVYEILFSQNKDLEDEILTNFIKQSTQQRGKEEQREKTQVWAISAKIQRVSQKGQRNKFVMEQEEYRRKKRKWNLKGQ